MYVVIILLIIIILSLLLYYKINKQKIEEKIKQEYINTHKKELENNLYLEIAKIREKADLEHKLHLADLEKEEGRLEAIIKTGEETIRQLEKRKEEQTKLINEAINDKKKIVDTEIEAYRQVETQKAAVAIQDWAKLVRSAEEESLAAYKGEAAQYKQTLQEELAGIQVVIDAAKAELDDYKKKQQVINEEILRRRQVEEQQDFYRIVLSDSAIQDMQILLSVRENLKMRENLDKLIYEAYVSKPTVEMIKRVLNGRAPSGIYKITRMKTGEIYIGKSTDVKKRWGEHSKTAYGVGTIAHSVLHTTIKKDGIENFTFELLEEVPKDKLTEREKYWINFYGS